MHLPFSPGLLISRANAARSSAAPPQARCYSEHLNRHRVVGVCVVWLINGHRDGSLCLVSRGWKAIPHFLQLCSSIQCCFSNRLPAAFYFLFLKRFPVSLPAGILLGQLSPAQWLGRALLMTRYVLVYKVLAVCCSCPRTPNSMAGRCFVCWECGGRCCQQCGTSTASDSLAHSGALSFEVGHKLLTSPVAKIDEVQLQHSWGEAGSVTEG